MGRRVGDARARLRGGGGGVPAVPAPAVREGLGGRGHWGLYFFLDGHAWHYCLFGIWLESRPVIRHRPPAPELRHHPCWVLVPVATVATRGR
eukprot:COSAG04_NODE_4277_length_2189_cov_5.921053_2_plen_92_part_00